MGATSIEWTDQTWNPVVGCTRVSPGCKYCYAFELHDMRHRAHLAGSKVPKQYAKPFKEVQLMPERLDDPLHWKKPRMVFVNSMSDLFHEDIPDEFITKVFVSMAAAGQHTFQVLTKRAERMREFILSKKRLTEEPLRNVWLGVSVEDQQRADERIPVLNRTPAAVRFLSCEPLLGPVNLRSEHIRWAIDGECDQLGYPLLDWVIVGGESGMLARPMELGWARSIRDQCVAAHIPFFFKQWGDWAPSETLFDAGPHSTTQRLPRSMMVKTVGGVEMLQAGKKAAGRTLDGRLWDEFPTVAIPA